MKIHLDEPEIKRALEQYVRQKVNVGDASLEIAFTAGRNPPTVTADIDIIEQDSEESIVTEVAGKEDTEDMLKKPFSDEQGDLPFKPEPTNFLGVD